MAEATVVIEAKPWYKSTTLIFNALALVAMGADYAVGQGFAFVNEPWFPALVGAVNFGLRFRTQRPVAASQKQVDVKQAA